MPIVHDFNYSLHNYYGQDRYYQLSILFLTIINCYLQQKICIQSSKIKEEFCCTTLVIDDKSNIYQCMLGTTMPTYQHRLPSAH